MADKAMRDEEDMEYREVWIARIELDGSKHVVGCALGYFSEDGNEVDESTLVLFTDINIENKEVLMYFLTEAVADAECRTIMKLWGHIVVVEESHEHGFRVSFFAPSPAGRREVREKYDAGDWVEELRSFRKIVENEEKIVVN